MTTAVLSIVAFALLFAGFGLFNRGREEHRRCGSCKGECGPDERECDSELKRLK